MNARDLIPASQCAQRYGVKALAHGGPGSGKTPLTKTAPRPVMLVTEPGMLSMRDAHNIPAFPAATVARIDEFFAWLTSSAEIASFDTVIVDSVSQMAEIVLNEEMPKHKDPRRAYGEMSKKVMGYANTLYFMPNKHAYLIAKQILVDIGGVLTRKYFFPGQDLNVKIPHLYDEIICVGKFAVPGAGVAPIAAIQCQPTYDVIARDRSGKLSTYEPPDLAALFRKAMT